jgi:hypothetical protein
MSFSNTVDTALQLCSILSIDHSVCAKKLSGKLSRVLVSVGVIHIIEDIFSRSKQSPEKTKDILIDGIFSILFPFYQKKPVGI